MTKHQLLEKWREASREEIKLRLKNEGDASGICKALELTRDSITPTEAVLELTLAISARRLELDSLELARDSLLDISGLDLKILAREGALKKY